VFPSFLNLFLACNFKKNELHLKKKFPLMAENIEKKNLFRSLFCAGPGGYLTCGLSLSRQNHPGIAPGLSHFLSWHLLCIVISKRKIN
jgi:hypothetical protein